MANVTITLDNSLLRETRLRAARQGTSVNAVIRQLVDVFKLPEIEQHLRSSLDW